MKTTLRMILKTTFWRKTESYKNVRDCRLDDSPFSIRRYLLGRRTSTEDGIGEIWAMSESMGLEKENRAR